MYPLDDPYYKELSAFVDSLRTGTPVPINLYEARDAAQIALAALTSIETGAVVNL